MLTRYAWSILLAASVEAGSVSIHKVDYPEVGFCGEEHNVTRSQLNPHYFFPMHFGGFDEGPCSNDGYSVFVKEVVVAMHPVPWVHHNLTFFLYSKPSPITELSLVDPSRKNRKVSAKVCSPPHRQGSLQKWPLYIFGHGFDCKPEDYAYFCSVAVTVMVYERNLTFIDFNTKGLAADADFLSRELPQRASKDPTFPLYGMLNDMVLLGGHSMGGGTSVLAAAQNSAARGMALFAPGLYTFPSATPYLKDVEIPTLIVSGSDDCGPNQLPKQAQPAFDGLASQKKVLVVLKGANHCQWADPAKGEIGVCTLHECALIDRATQHRLGLELFSAFVHGLEQDWGSFEQTLSRGEHNGTWAYFSSLTSESSKKLHNDCPCKKEFVI
jgi:pimeloyl-ACP methyl ester carboxylesterase